MHEIIHELATRQHGVVGRAQLIGLGVPKDVVERQCRSWTRLHQGVYALPGTVETFSRRVMAAQLAAGGLCAASHLTAAHLLGLTEEPEVIEISVPRAQRPRLDGVIVYRPTLFLPEHLAWIGPIRVTNGNRTVCDLAGRDEGPLFLDRALKKRIAHPKAIRALLEKLTRQPGRAALLELCDARPGAKPLIESGLEHVFHRLLREAGITGWIGQLELEADGKTFRLDAAFPAVKLGIEVDSYAHHSSLPEWERDRTRNALLVVRGWRILSITRGDLRDRPVETMALIRRAVAAGGAGVAVSG